MPVLWSLTCATVKLSLFQGNDFIIVHPTESVVGQKQLIIFRGLQKYENAKNHFIEAKIYKATESVIPYQTLSHHQLGYVYHRT